MRKRLPSTGHPGRARRRRGCAASWLRVAPDGRLLPAAGWTGRSATIALCPTPATRRPPSSA